MDTIQPHSFDVLGGLEKKPDPRDVSLGSLTPKTYTFPAVYTNAAAWAAPVEYQGQQPACGAHAGASMLGIKQNGHYSPRFTWTNIKTFDGWPVADGTDIRSIFKSLYNAGGLDFALLGNDVSLDLSTYAHAPITVSEAQNAALHKAPGYGFMSDFSFNGIKQYISDHGGVLLLIRVSARLYTAANGQISWSEQDILPLAPPDSQFPVISGHFIYAHSYDENYIYFLNSFSSSWGRNGHGYFGEDYMPFIVDGGAPITLAFDKDLHFGLTDPEVKTLQQTLNKNTATQVANSGAGSPGNETEYFGNLTRQAVIKFQQLHNISPTLGYVGPLTRAVLNTLI